MARKIEIEITGDTKSLSHALGKAAGDTDRFGSSMGKLGSVVKGLAFGAAAAGIGGLAATLAIGSKEWAEHAKVAAQTEAVLKSTGGAAGVTQKSVEGLAGALLAKTGIDDEAIQSGENLLLTFTNIRNEVGKGNDIFTQSTKVMTDMSVALGQDMKSSAIQLGKALNDPVRGLTALQRVGVSFTGAQKEQVKALVESGHAMQAQKLILAELNKEFGGSAEAIGKTLPGQINILKESFYNLAGALVGGLVPAFTGVVSGITGFVAHISEAEGAGAKLSAVWGGISGAVKDGANAIVAAFQAIDWGAVASKLGDGARSALASVKDAFASIDWQAVGSTIATGLSKALAVLGTIRDKVLSAIGPLASTIFNGLVSAIQAVNWGAVGQSIGKFVATSLGQVASFVRSVDWNKVGQAAVSGLGTMVVAIGRFLLGVNWGAVVGGAFRLLAAVIIGAGSLLLGAATALGSVIIKGIGAGLAGLVDFVLNKLSYIGGAVKQATVWVVREAVQLGKDLVAGVLSGLGGIVETVYNKVKGGIESAISNVGGFFGIGSPSTYTRDKIGVPLSQGVVSGVSGLGAELAAAFTAQISTGIDAGATAATAKSALFTVAGSAAGNAYVLGITQTAPKISGEMGSAVSGALEAVKTKVAAAQGGVTAAFAKLGAAAVAAFNAKTALMGAGITARFDKQLKAIAGYGDTLTKSEAALKALDQAEETRSRNLAVQSAAAQLAAANAMVEGPEKEQALAAAKEAVRQADLANQRAALQASAEAERAAATTRIAQIEADRDAALAKLDESRARQAEKLAQQFTDLGAFLAKHPAEYDKTAARIKKILDKLGIDIQVSGRTVGQAYAKGIDSAAADVEKAAKRLAAIVRSNLETHSPAKEGPLSTLDKWWKSFAPTLISGLDTTAIRDAIRAATGAGGGVGFGSAGSRSSLGVGRGGAVPVAAGAGGGDSYTFYISGVVGDADAVSRVITKALSQRSSRNG